MPTHPLFLPSVALNPPSHSLLARSARRSINRALPPLPSAHLPLHPKFHIPNLRGRSLRVAVIATSAALISIDILHTYSHSIQDQLHLAVPDALASTAATAVFCTALESRFNLTKRRSASLVRPSVELDDSGVPLTQGPAICTPLLDKAFEEVAGEVGVTGFVVCQGTDVIYAMGDGTPGVGAGRAAERVHQVQRAVYMGRVSGRSGVPFKHQVTAVYLVPVSGLVVGFGNGRGFGVRQRRYLRALADRLLPESARGDGQGS